MPTEAAPSTVAAVEAEPPAAVAPATHGAETEPPAAAPKVGRKLLVPEDAELVGQWQDTYSHDEPVPIAIYLRGSRYYFAMELPSGSVMRVPLEKQDETRFVRVNGEYGEQFVITNGDLQTLDDDGVIGTSKPLP